MGRRRGAVLALVLTVGIGLPAAPAAAHGGSDLAEPIFEHMAPTVAGVKVSVVHSVNYQFIVSNDGGQAITFLADSGEPFLRIGPDGVHGNFASPTFYDSNSPEGAGDLPEQAKPGPDVTPIWRRIATEPSWGWYDHRLHPADRIIPPEILKANKVAVLGRWTVPFRIGDQAGEIQGRFEYRPPTGSYSMEQKSARTPVDGVTIQVVSASRVPAIFVENLSSEPLVVLGKDDEPFARIGPTITEVNVKSPAWAAMQQALGKTLDDEADATAEPKWQQIADAPKWQWLEFRAAAPETDPPQPIVERKTATTVRNWSVPYLVGGKRLTVDGITQFVPIAVLRQQAGGSQPESEKGPDLPLYAGLGLAVAVLGGGGWLVTSILRSRAK
jgi:hypothetical protein